MNDMRMDPRERAIRELEALASLHLHMRGAGQTHALITGAVEWARGRPQGKTAAILVTSQSALRHARELVEKLCPRELRALVRVEPLEWLTRDGRGWSGGPVLLDGSAVVELGTRVRGVPYQDAIGRFEPSESEVE